MVVGFSVGEASAPSFDHNAFGWEMGWTARSIFLGHGFTSPFAPLTGPTALVPPIYPYLLAGFFHLFGLYTPQAAFAAMSFNSLCSALTCIPIYFLARNSLDTRAARIAAFAWAIYPFAIYFSANRVWDYALTTLLFTCALLVAQKLHLHGSFMWAGFGLLYGVAVLSNPSIVTLLPVLLLIAMYKVRRVDGAWFAKGLIASLAFIAVCAPWAVRNTQVMHSTFFLRDGFWIEFYAGNSGDTTDSNAASAHPASNPVEMQKFQKLGETAYIADKRVLAIDLVSHHPRLFAIACVRRAVRFWTGYWSFRPEYLAREPFDIPNLPFCLFLTFMMVRGLLRWLRDDLGAVLPYLFAIIIFPLPYYLTHSSMDYRQPIEPVIVMLVTVGLFGISETNFEADAEEEFEVDPQDDVAPQVAIF